MGKAWQACEAKARFDEFLEASVSEGPQIVTRGGVETAVLVLIDLWRRLQKLARPDPKELLLALDARTKTLVSPGGDDVKTCLHARIAEHGRSMEGDAHEAVSR